MDGNMKILVTGSGGLLGSSLKNKLQGENIFHTRKDVDLTNYDETFNYVKKCKEKFGVNTIIHCAALVGGVKANTENNRKFFDENFHINSNVIKSSLLLDIENFVNVSSTCVFPYESVQYPLTSKDIYSGVPHPSNEGYAYAKRISGYEVEGIKKMTGKNWINVVSTNLYGPNDNFNLETSHMIAGLIHKGYLAKKNKDKLVVWGDGSQMRQFVHSDDMAELILWSLKNWSSEIPCMLINEEEFSVKKICEIIKQKFGLVDNDIVFDLEKPMGLLRKPAKTDVPNFKFISLEDGISQTIDWFVENYKTCRK